MIFGTSESLHQAVDAFQGYIPLAQSLRSVYLHSDQVAVWHLFSFLFTTLSSSCILHMSAFPFFIDVWYALFVSFANTLFLELFDTSGAPKSPG